MTRRHDQTLDLNRSSVPSQRRTTIQPTWRGVLILALSCAVAGGDDWPTYMHDSTRSGVTPERLGPPLSERWRFVSKRRPQPAWPDPGKEAVKVCYDQAFHVAVVGDALYFGSSADNKVYSLDAATGKVNWTAFTNGPVRIAPTIRDGRVFVGSDDGQAYCLNASDGEVVWQRRGGPNDRRVLGNGRMMSVWPIRTGVLVDDGIAYFCAGLFPTESVFLYALRAEDGEVLWRNDTCGQLYVPLPHGGTEAFSGISPEGPLLASETRLYVPLGRQIPAAFDRKDGRLAYFKSTALRGGGTWALLTDDLIFTGPAKLVAYRAQAGDSFANFPGRRLVVTSEASYLLTDTSLTGVDRKTYTALTHEYTKLSGQIRGLSRKLRKPAAQHKALSAKLKTLTDEEQTPSEEQIALKKKLDVVDKQFRPLKEKMDALAAEAKRLRTGLSACTKWRLACKCPHALIFAGGVLFAGGQDQVIAVDAKTGEKLWTGKVAGKAWGLAASGGRLFASTDTGTIHCFGKGSPDTARPAIAVEKQRPAAPYPQDSLTPLYAAAAETIVRDTGVTKGYCLVLGCRKGRLAYELARRTDLRIYGVEPDRDSVEAARSLLDAAGLYGARVTVDQGSLSRLPYPDYFANLVVSDDVTVSGRIREGTSAAELLRVLRPHGGVAYIGQPPDAARAGEPANAAHLRKWLKGSNIPNSTVTEARGVWAKILREPLEGAGEWTHQYADAANTACSDDQRVACPLGLLWFGRPGPARIIDRHSHPPAPLSTGGRIFIPADERVIALDAYNGTELWETPMPGCRRVNMSRDAGDTVATADAVFRAFGGACWRLDAATGKHTFTYSVPPAPDGKPRDWGYVACPPVSPTQREGTQTEAGALLFGSATKPKSTYTLARGNFYAGVSQKAVTSEYLFAVERRHGELRWLYRNGIIINTAIAIGGDRVFFVESRGEAAMKSAVGQLGNEILDKQFLVALDAGTGKKLWEKNEDLRACGTATKVSHHRDTVVVWGTTGQCTLAAFSAQTGTRLWTQTYATYAPRSSRGMDHPILIGDTIYAEPYAYDLRTGKPKMRSHPITGEAGPWRMSRAYGCGIMSASPSCLFYRSGSIGIYDLEADAGTSNWGGMRPGCWINIIAAAGLALIPEASAGCVCAYPIQTTVALAPIQTNENWSVFDTPGATTPVRHMAINLGAPGDRRDPKGTLWFAYPRPRARFGVRFKLETEIMPGGGYFRHNADAVTIQQTDTPWVFSSGCVGLVRCALPLIGKDQPPGVYTIRLSFADLTSDPAAERVFDVKLQGKSVLSGFSVTKEAGGPNKAIVKELRGVKVEDALTIELIPAATSSTIGQAPVLSGIEVVRQEG